MDIPGCQRTKENRLRLGRFLLVREYDTVPRQVMLEGFDAYAKASQVAMRVMHHHFSVRRHV